MPAAAPHSRPAAAAPGWLTRVRGVTAARILLLTVIAAKAADPVVDPDAFWHVATGKLILRTHTIPKVDPFSWTAPGRAWVAHEWLIEIVFAVLHRLAGWPGLVVYAIVTITAAWAIVGRTARRLGASPGITNLIVAVSALSCIHTWGARPQMLSLLFGALFADFLVQAWQGRPNVLWWCVPIMLLWCNAHGGYMFGISMMFLFACALTTERVVGRIAPRWRPEPHAMATSALHRCAWTVVVCTAAVSLINPNGVKGFLYPFSYLGDNASTRYVEEWFAPTFARLQWWPFFVLIGLALMTIWKSHRTLPAFVGVGMVVYGALGVQSVRNITQFSFFAAPWIALTITRGMSALRERSATVVPGTSKGSSPLRTVLPLAALISALSIAVINIGGLLPGPNANAQAVEFPVGAAAYLREHPTQNLYNTYDWGGYLILNLRQPVGIDGRPDMYGDAFVDRYVATWNLAPGWEQRLRDAKVKSVLAQINEPIAKKLRAPNSGWTVQYEDRRAILFRRP